MTPRLIEAYTGLKIKSVTPVSGGNTSNAYKLNTDSGSYFFKEKEFETCPGLFEKEANGLSALAKKSELIVPKVLKKNLCDSKQFILLNWLDKKKPSKESWIIFGAELAKMHSLNQPYFGFFENNYLGSLIQNNTPNNLWSAFYTQCRLIPFATELLDSGILNNSDIKAIENLCRELENIFPYETPSLLHGDLWHGNCMFTNNGPAIFDPATYYGHREMDIGMSLLFGGFNNIFYESYDQTYPLAKGWKDRLPYSQLYPLLAHAVFFKGFYISSVRQILKPFYR
ncbi:MAG: fructosamine kinase family protein [Bacteroidia bacterium]